MTTSGRCLARTPGARWGGRRGATTPEGYALGQSARQVILRRYDWDARLRGFDDLMRPAGPAPSDAAVLTEARA